MLQKMLDAAFAREALGAARRQLADEERGARPQLQQARLLAEVIRRVAEPSQTLPAGDRAAIILTLTREAVFLTLEAARARTEAPAGSEPRAEFAAAADAASAWEATPPAVLSSAVTDASALPALKDLLTGPVRPGTPARAEDAAAARAFLERLLWNADSARRQIERILVQRFVAVVGIVLIVALLVLGVRALTTGANLAAGKPMRTSSSWSGCASDPMCDGVLLFHTNPENEPWVEFDLLAPTSIKRIELVNRADCCTDRTVPLVAEISLDHVHWTEVGRRVEEFAQWTLKFAPRTTRYVRLRIARASTFHLKDVIIR